MQLDLSDLRKKSDNELLTLFQEAATLHGRATLEGDYRAGNQAFKVVSNVYEEMKSRNVARELLNQLLSYEDVNVRSMAASRLLPIESEKAIQVLKEVVLNDKTILGFNAEMVLKQWEKGELIF